MTNREAMVRKILKHQPCIGEETVRKWSKFWPKNVTLHWLLTHTKRGNEQVPIDNSTWLAQVLMPYSAQNQAEERVHAKHGVWCGSQEDYLAEYAVEAKKLECKTRKRKKITTNKKSVRSLKKSTKKKSNRTTKKR